MNTFDVIKDIEGKDYLVFDSSELYDDTKIGNKFEDFEIIKKLGEGSFGKVFKVRSKLNNKIYAMKMLDLDKLKSNPEAYRLSKNEIHFLEIVNHPHIEKSFKSFEENDFLYIIIEFIRNGDMEGFINANIEFNHHIPEEQLWSIFYQCISALKYIHSKNIIHRDIKPKNIFIDNNLSIKIGDFGCSAIQKKENQYLNGCIVPKSNFINNNNQNPMVCSGTAIISKGYTAAEVSSGKYDDKIDVYSMGATFYYMCYAHIPYIEKKDFNGNVISYIKNDEKKDNYIHYSKELLNIINLMLEQDKNKRKNSQEIFEMIKNEYFKRYVRNTSIESIIRCLISFDNLNNYFLNVLKYQNNNMPISQAYINCLESFKAPLLDQWINSINYFREILGSENAKLEGAKEIDPRFVFAFLIKQLHKELNQPKINDITNNHLLVSSQGEYKTNSEEMFLKYINDIDNKFNSIISNNFLGLMKTTNKCKVCELITYSFSSFFFVTFDLQKISQLNNNSYIDLIQNFSIQNNIIESNFLYCIKCLNKTTHSCNNHFYYSPNLLIISIQRGITFQYKNPINITEILDLSSIFEFQYCPKRFRLVGILKRKEDNNGNEVYFSYIYFYQKWIRCEGTNISEINFPFNFESEGDTIMLFYQRIN